MVDTAYLPRPALCGLSAGTQGYRLNRPSQLETSAIGSTGDGGIASLVKRSVELAPEVS